MEIPRVMPADITEFLKKNGKAGQKILAALQELYPELAAVFGTEIGKELLLDDIQRIDELFLKVYQEKATAEERAEFRYLRDVRVPRVLGKLALYIQKVQQVKGGSR